jgi:aspartate kinase
MARSGGPDEHAPEADDRDREEQAGEHEQHGELDQHLADPRAGIDDRRQGVDRPRMGRQLSGRKTPPMAASDGGGRRGRPWSREREVTAFLPRRFDRPGRSGVLPPPGAETHSQPGSGTCSARMPHMPNPLVVMKFGGSSLGNAERIKRVARRIARERAGGARLVVVVSAMGDTTDELLALAAAITDEPDARELDVLLATGEHQSATLMSMALQSLGVPAISLTGPQAGITTDGRYGKARIAGIDPRRVQAELAAGKVVIVAGFQGMSVAALEGLDLTPTASDVHAAEITTLGRGGSDTTAVALAAQLRADRCQIYTDVTGIYTADPRIATDARQLPVVGYEEMMELAHQGAQVMQVRAVELGWVNNVVIEVLSSFEDAPGTQIREDPLVEQRNKVRGIAHDRNVAKITLVDVPDRPGVARSVFGPLADNGINVDMIVQNVGHGAATDLSFTVPRVELAKAKRILEPLIRELGFRDMTMDSSVAKVSIVGAGIHNAPGYAARMFGTLADAGINIEMISTSEIRITTIIAEDRVEEAVRALHAAFELEQPESIQAAVPAAS